MKTWHWPASKGSYFVCTNFFTKTFDDKSSLKAFPEDAHYGVLKLKRINCNKLAVKRVEDIFLKGVHYFHAYSTIPEECRTMWGEREQAMH